ncbi:MAG TPA: HAMP domain-containing sensor histidine kinase [Vicinamibacterales bacterium]|nr:HAMP domain-containing sensor histidine kinase [Vicinamibacterales bacterium]
MQVIAADGPPSPFPVRALLRLLVAAASAAVCVALAGWLLQRLYLGPNDAAARSRVETDVRRTFDEMAQQLRSSALLVADPALVRQAVDDDSDVSDAAAGRLFNAARDAVGAVGGSGEAAVTVFAADRTPLAWAGRPSEPPAEELAGVESYAFSATALGPRLLYIRPVGEGAARAGIIVAERSIGSGIRPTASGSLRQQGSSGDVTIPTRLAPVTVRPAGVTAPGSPDETFQIASPDGRALVTATVSASDLRATRERWQRATRSLSLLTFSAAIVLLIGPLLDWRNRTLRASDFIRATVLAGAVVIIARLLARMASPADWSETSAFSSSDYAGTLLPPLLTSPFDFMLTALAGGALAGLLIVAVEAWRVSGWRHRLWTVGSQARLTYVTVQLLAGVGLAALVSGYQELLQNTIANTNLDLLHFSLSDWDASRLALQFGLVLAHATAIALGVVILRAAQARWCVPRWEWQIRILTVACWLGPLIVWRLRSEPAVAQLPLLVSAVTVALFAHYGTKLAARFRHGSQAARLTLLILALIVPAFAFYPTMFQLAWRAKSQLVETIYAPQALNQRGEVQRLLEMSLEQIDALPNLSDLVVRRQNDTVQTEPAFEVWRSTPLANYPVTSSVELFDADGQLVSRYAFNLPEELVAPPRSQENKCTWQTFGVTNPFFAEERQVLHAGRLLPREGTGTCGTGPGESGGSIVVHAMQTDYENLPFIPSRSPYVDLVRPEDPLRVEGIAGQDIEYAVYGWSRRPVFSSSGTAWPLTEDVFAEVSTSRKPRWVELRRGDQRFETYLRNDRAGIYALGFPVVSALDHLVHLAELTVLAVLACLLLRLLNGIFSRASGRVFTAPALLREIRASFYRKLFIAVVAAVFVPVVALAIVTRLYVAERMRTNIEQEAVRTANTAARVVEDLVAPRAAAGGVLGIEDNLMVWVSRLIDQDVNYFSGTTLQATSERNLFASGFLPTRTPAEVQQALQLDREAAVVVREQVAGLNPHLVAAMPLFDTGILTVPLTTRQQEIEQEIDALDRRVLLAALLFILGGAGIGYSMAERISDPVNRLTRATRRIARGDLDARVAATSSDELGRLVEDFNSMARDLQRQRAELERTNRLEAWAEMARQVAHEIKNPLTPIQLNAEHLRRVHADRGEPLAPVLQDCVATILTQVRLLRQIASEFSSFASSPTARPSAVDVPELLEEVVNPYRVGLAERIRFEVDVPSDLPRAQIDRTLIARSLTNIVENALHAMPSAGVLSVVARATDHRVRVSISDTGVGMDAEALERVFEPYFSTKASGTGLGLPIAKRNVELTGGTIAVTSERDRGTTVELTLPTADTPISS